MKALDILEVYTRKLTTLRRGGTSYGLAPHKPIFLLTIIDLVESGDIRVNRIPLSEKLFEQFAINWKLLVPNVKVGDITQPIYHLQNEGFWLAIKQDGNTLEGRLTSKKQVLKQLVFGQLDDSLFELLSDVTYRPIIKMVLLDTYFAATQASYLNVKSMPNYISEIEGVILEEKKSSKKMITRVEERFVRDWKFRQNVLSIYNNTCCISRLRIEPSSSIIEACHIQPHAQFGIDTITNGIPLCANLHKAFDEGMISMDANYRVLIKGKKAFKENDSPYNIRQFEGAQILLPNKEVFYPSLERLKWHQNRFGFKVN